MALTSALLVSLALSADPGRILLCRPVVAADPALARADAVAAAGRELQGAYLDYGVPCETEAEAARAAGRAALAHGLFTRAEGRVEGSAYALVLVSPAQEEAVSRQVLTVAPGADPVIPLREALKAIDRSIPRPPPRWSTVAGWTLTGTGAAVLAGGAVLALQARSEARRATRAATPGEYLSARHAWERRSRQAGGAAIAGGALLGAGLALHLAF
jgi:hypothetical protein